LALKAIYSPLKPIKSLANRHFNVLSCFPIVSGRFPSVYFQWRFGGDFGAGERRW
jgi:hypothetical protein